QEKRVCVVVIALISNGKDRFRRCVIIVKYVGCLHIGGKFIDVATVIGSVTPNNVVVKRRRATDTVENAAPCTCGAGSTYRVSCDGVVGQGQIGSFDINPSATSAAIRQGSIGIIRYEVVRQGNVAGLIDKQPSTEGVKSVEAADVYRV